MYRRRECMHQVRVSPYDTVCKRRVGRMRLGLCQFWQLLELLHPLVDFVLKELFHKLWLTDRTHCRGSERRQWWSSPLYRQTVSVLPPKCPLSLREPFSGCWCHIHRKHPLRWGCPTSDVVRVNVQHPRSHQRAMPVESKSALLVLTQ